SSSAATGEPALQGCSRSTGRNRASLALDHLLPSRSIRSDPVVRSTLEIAGISNAQASSVQELAKFGLVNVSMIVKTDDESLIGSSTIGDDIRHPLFGLLNQVISMTEPGFLSQLYDHLHIGVKTTNFCIPFVVYPSSDWGEEFLNLNL